MMDYLIIGAGPAGLAFATCLPAGTRAIILERESSIGGCHRVRRTDDGSFSEHGPRVYSGAYATTSDLLDQIGLSWAGIFQKVEYSPEKLDGKRWFQHLSVWESCALSLEFAKMILGKVNTQESVRGMAMRYGFSKASIAYLDHICRFSDGAGAGRYTVYEFLQGFDQHMMYAFYQPRLANDRLLFPAWHAYLENRGIHVVTSAKVSEVRGTSVVLENGTVVKAKRVICAIPPERLDDLIPGNRVTKFAKATKYNDYVSVAMFFDSPDPLPESAGIRTTPWGITWCSMRNEESPGLLSCAITLPDIRSPRTGKTANQCTEPELVAEMIAQLSGAYGVDLRPTKTRLSTGLAKVNGEWEDSDTAFVSSAGVGFMNPDLGGGVWSLGTHNGMSTYNFTSFESAVQNAVNLARILEPASRVSTRASHDASSVAGILVMVVVLIAMYVSRR